MTPRSQRPRTAKGRRQAKAADSLLVKGAQVVTLDDRFRVDKLDLRIDGGRIAEIGNRLSSRGVGRVLDAKGLVAMPGLVQCHVHLCQTLFRGQAEQLELLPWLQQRIWPLEGALSAQDTRASVRLGLAELLLGGTTSVLDMGTVQHGDVLFEEAKRSGIRYTGGKTIMDYGQGYPAALRETTEEAMVESQRLCDEWHGADAGRLRYAFSPRYALCCTQEVLRACVAEARSRGALLHTHAAESGEEVATLRERTGMGNVEYLHSLGFTGPDVLLAHGIWLSAAERSLLRETQTRVIHCPSANLKLASGIARLQELLEDGIPLGLGADGAACNNCLDGFMEMRLAALLHKVRSGPGAISARTALRLATLDGAAALGLDCVGSIEVGKEADIILLDLYKPHAWPDLADMHQRIVYSAKSSDVHTVLVRGRPLVEEGVLTQIRLPPVLREARVALERVLASVGEAAPVAD